MSNIPLTKIKKIDIILNPASGRIEPILPIINIVMKEADIQWEVFVTKKADDARRFAQQSVKKNIDAVAVYGGDGTVREVISGMMGSDMPLAILPGGTGNVLATDLNIPKDLKAACQLMSGASSRLKTIDIGEFNQRYFTNRLGMGFEADMMKGADRRIKNRFGRLAYVFSSAAALKKLREVQYHLKIDGKEYDETGITCIVANSGKIGFYDLSLDDDMDLSDGLLDVIIVRRVNISLLAYIITVFFHKQNSSRVEVVQHWQGREIAISSVPPQTVQCDGEVLEKLAIRAKIIPNAVNVIVPDEHDKRAI